MEPGVGARFPAAMRVSVNGQALRSTGTQSRGGLVNASGQCTTLLIGSGSRRQMLEPLCLNVTGRAWIVLYISRPISACFEGSG